MPKRKCISLFLWVLMKKEENYMNNKPNFLLLLERERGESEAVCVKWITCPLLQTVEITPKRGRRRERTSGA